MKKLISLILVANSSIGVGIGKIIRTAKLKQYQNIFMRGNICK